MSSQFVIAESLRQSLELSRFSDDDASSRVSTPEEAKKYQEELAAKETRAVNLLRLLLASVLIIAAAVLGTLVYLYTHEDQEDEFEETFAEFSKLIADTVQTSAQNRLEAIGALATQIQAHVYTTNSTWPFVTVPFFERQVDVMNSLTDAFSVVMYPLVYDELRPAWEAYTIENRHWVNESYDTQIAIHGESQAYEKLPNQTWFDVFWPGDEYVSPNNTDYSYGFSDQIYGFYDPDSWGPVVSVNYSHYFPLWHAAPMTGYQQSNINQDFAYWWDFWESSKISIETGEAVMGEAWSDYIATGYITTMLYPVYEEFEAEEPNVVAFLGADILWKDYLTGILPDTADGIVVLIENTYGENFTYKLSGPEVEFVGDGDHHNSDFDYLEESFLFGEHLFNQSESYTGAPLHDGFYQYTFRIYPSEKLEDEYVDNQPVLFTIMTCVIFLFTSMVFVMYDCYVERRQRLVLTTALKSDAIVSSLFPDSVKNKLYKKDEPEEPRNFEAKAIGGESLREIMDKIDESEEYNHPEGAPIADLYENATVFFADIAGFTAWSSGRQPVDVFLLLETVYGAFDKLAAKRGVFKIETIGDCYVAVTGLPKPREDHAIAMTKFAWDMLRSFRKEIGNLQTTLGPETMDLAMRVGIHSGPVTAGVLRGEKARFQLFGDTMNTAARMESTSSRNCIQVSQDTADLLIAAGKTSWLTARREKVTPKGKGEMQTYWVKPPMSTPSASVPSVSTDIEPTGEETEPTADSMGSLGVD